MKLIRTSILTLLLTVFALNIYAQSDAVKRAANSIFTLTTFRPDGTILASSHGVFVGKNGLCPANSVLTAPPNLLPLQKRP